MGVEYTPVNLRRYCELHARILYPAKDPVHDTTLVAIHNSQALHSCVRETSLILHLPAHYVLLRKTEGPSHKITEAQSKCSFDKAPQFLKAIDAVLPESVDLLCSLDFNFC